MANLRTFWSPGVSTLIEFPERVSFQRRFGWGLEVEQRADSIEDQNNWFHIPLPCESRTHYRGGQTVDAFMLHMRVNENARVAELHLRDGPQVIADLDVNFVDQTIDREFRGPPSPSHWVAFGANSAGLTLCIRVEFLSGSPRGHATFFGAAVRLHHIND